ncbi:MAG TPA: hypothetical protein VGI12_19700 [Vicinamibacterales bacterium]|jgi:hypothetical protein
MPVTVLNGVYHQQDNDFTCGAAVGQMVIGDAGVDFPHQSTLYNQTQAYPTADPGPAWLSSPDGLTYVINHRLPGGEPFSLFALNHPDVATRKLVWTIHQHGRPGIALVEGSGHWVLVHGYDVTAQPVSSQDATYGINAVEIQDPWPPKPGGVSTAHHAGDGCGSGGTRGDATRHIAYANWLSMYLTGDTSGMWMGKFLVICDQDPAAPDAVAMPVMSVPAGLHIIVAADAQVAAIQGVSQYDLASRDPWRSCLASTTPGTPLLVHRLDHPNAFYYLVPFLKRDGTSPVTVAVDATTGTYLETSAAYAAGDTLHGPVVLTKDEAMKLVVGTHVDMPEQRGRILVRPEAATLYEPLVWRPCIESLTPFLPFHLIIQGKTQIFVRLDGAVFTGLTDLRPGM